jgi:hypothetical protein
MLQKSGRLPYENNADKAQGFYKDRKLSLDANEVLQLRCEKKLGRAIVAPTPGISEPTPVTCSENRSLVPPLAIRG